MRRILTAVTAVLLMAGFTGAAMAQSPTAATRNSPVVDKSEPGDHGQPPGDCEDGQDNDADQLVDAADPGCQLPGCQPSTQQPNKCHEADDEGTAPDDCADGIDNEGDGLIDADDPDCQPGGSGDETNDDSGGGAADPCSSAGLVTDPTLGQTLWDGGLQVPPLTEDPYPDGALSGPLSQAADGTPLQPVFLEAGCAVDLLIDGSVGGDL
jgi:hypothetical protein